MRYRTAIAATVSAALVLVTVSARARPSGPVRALACAPSSPGIAVALVGDSVWTTRDHGNGWARVAVLSETLADDRSPAADSDLGLTSIEREVIPDLEPVPVEEQHRIDATGIELSTAADPYEYDVVGASADLAIGDDGTWAALIRDELFVGSPASGIRGHVQLESVHGVFVDSRGGIWVSGSHALLHFPLGSPIGSAPRRFPLACTGPPVRGVGSEELLVTVRDGLAVIAVGRGDQPGVELVRSGSLAAVAAAPDGVWLAVSRGRIVRLERTGVTETLGPAPGKARRLLVARGRQMWVLTSGGIWYRGDRRGWRAETALVVEVDALGRAWFGTAHGPIGPGTRQGPPIAADSLPAVRASTFVGGALRLLDDELGDPPCHPQLNPLPTVRLVAGAGHGSTREIELPGPLEEAGLTTWVYAEIWLSWSFGPVAPTECLSRLESAADLRDERRRRVAGLVEAWRRAVAAEAGARSIAEVIEARSERDRLAELIRIASGIDPPEEER